MTDAARRAGTTLAETLVVLVLTGVVTAVAARALRHAGRLARDQARVVAVQEAVEVVRFVLNGELRSLDPAGDLLVRRDSAALRAFRGLAVVCGGTEAEPLVRVRGLRLPAPEKDSVLALDRAGAPAAVRASAAAPGACAVEEGERVLRLGLEVPVAGAVLGYYERGSYHLAERALRYRLGRAGRQPLTDEVFRWPAFEVAPGAVSRSVAAAMPVQIKAAAAATPRTDTARIRITLLNGTGRGLP